MNGFKIDIVVIIVLLLAGGAIGAWLFGSCGNYTPETTTTVTVRDTIIVRDTIRAEVPLPRVVEVVRYDTLFVPVTAEKDSAEVILSIEQKEYVTTDYRAVVEGYRPRLVSMELYRQTQIISDNTTTTRTKNPHWAVTLGVGAGWTPQGLQPYVGATFGYVIWSR